jgi:hypothetical protein
VEQRLAVHKAALEREFAAQQQAMEEVFVAERDALKAALVRCGALLCARCVRRAGGAAHRAGRVRAGGCAQAHPRHGAHSLKDALDERCRPASACL